MPPSPINVAKLLDYRDLIHQLQRVVNKMESTELEKIRLEIRTEYFNGINKQLWNSPQEFGEETMLLEKRTATAFRNQSSRLLNRRFGTRYGPTRETIIGVAHSLGIPAEDRLHNTAAMSAKRELTIRTVFPQLGSAWNVLYRDPLSLPFTLKSPFRPELELALSKAGMSPPEQFQTDGRFQVEIDAVRADVPDATSDECKCAALWRMMRPFLPGFDRRLWQVSREATLRNDPAGEELKSHLENIGTILRAIRHAANHAHAQQRGDEWILQTAAERLSERHGRSLSTNELVAFLHTRDTTIQAIKDRTAGAGWMIWHDPNARDVAHRLLRG